MKKKAKNGERERSRATVWNVSIQPSFFLEATVFLSPTKKERPASYYWENLPS